MSNIPKLRYYLLHVVKGNVLHFIVPSSWSLCKRSERYSSVDDYRHLPCIPISIRVQVRAKSVSRICLA